MLGTLESNHVGERGGCLGSFRSDLQMNIVGVFQIIFVLGRHVLFGRIYTPIHCSCGCWV